MEIEVRSIMPRTRRREAARESGADGVSKVREGGFGCQSDSIQGVNQGGLTSFIASPMTKTRVWSETVFGEVRKKKAIVIWKRARERMIVEALMRAILPVVGVVHF